MAKRRDQETQGPSRGQMNKTPIGVLVLCVGLVSCGLREGWVKADMTEQQRKADLYACERDMRMADAGPGLFRRCMEAKGYTQEK